MLPGQTLGPARHTVQGKAHGPRSRSPDRERADDPALTVKQGCGTVFMAETMPQNKPPQDSGLTGQPSRLGSAAWLAGGGQSVMRGAHPPGWAGHIVVAVSGVRERRWEAWGFLSPGLNTGTYSLPPHPISQSGPQGHVQGQGGQWEGTAEAPGDRWAAREGPLL